ncbi:hypothetical protein SAMN04490179_4626 [Pseudomonas antarctica]|uniref:Uncharacterized protein n=1 Tax=Pseudomonas antarctica TaxID=219572 RepID=A0A1H0C2Y7_9PSED|nr:hypothetical protein PSAN_49640 [Pseudomonas antarctica]SDN52271.1 hypothetical protein SAMN04490179_4626 [Pseudomonas antarctica]
MQGQKGYVNGYVVIFFWRYINRSKDGRMRENVTWASFFVRLVEGHDSRTNTQTLWERACSRMRCVS